MKIFTIITCIFLSLFILCGQTSFAQVKPAADSTKYKTVSAGPQYKKSAYYQFLWGHNYREEWTTPVKLPVMQLDTLRGGFISFKEGGSNQSKSLHIKTKGDKEYSLRSVDKSLDKVIPKVFHGTFISDLVNDEVSMSNPYGALAVPALAQAIGVKHTNPVYYYLPEQALLDTLNKKYANKVYLFEQRPKNNWSEADNLGNFSDFLNTDEIFPEILTNNDHEVDQRSFVRARLLDFLIGDFDRHADQWKWGVTKVGDKTIYEAVPTDRDQAYSTRDGILLDLLIRVTGMKYLQEFDYKLDDVKAYATINRVVDRIFTNKLVRADWENIAVSVQQQLTDKAIEAAVKNMPPEIFAIRGNTLIEKLKSRRSHLVEYATEYYNLLAEQTEIVGTKQDEYFEITNLANDQTSVTLYKLDANRQKTGSPFYSRLFDESETDEIRMYGIGGNDIYKITGRMNGEIKTRLIGGDGRDSIIDESTANGRKRNYIYDNADNYFKKGSNTRLRLSEDSAVHVYNYLYFLPDKKGLIPHFGYNDADRFFVGARYQFLDHKWRKLPFASRQSLDVDYSIPQKAFSSTYTGLFPELFGKWDLNAKANYDMERWINFFGLGNETSFKTTEIDFYRLRTEEAMANLGVSRKFNKSRLSIAGFYQRVKVMPDTARFISKSGLALTPNIFEADNFAGAQVKYSFADVKDSVLPQKGFTFSLLAKHTQNLKTTEKSFQTFSGDLQFFIPLIPKISLAIKTGASTITGGKPLFYQYPSIGESYDLRGFRRERFSGESTFYGNTELRYIKNVRSYIFNGQAGLMAFVDNGRVWLPGENSSKMHTAYGAGILLAPFNLVSASVTYGVSKEIKIVQLRLGILF